VIWTCHVGIDVPNDIARSAWTFLGSDARAAEAATFTRAAYAWEGLEPDALRVIPPCIDPVSPKNAALPRRRRAAILRRAGIIGTRGGASIPAADGGPVPPDASLVTQVSRWDRLKDPLGVIRGFAEEPRLDGAHLVLAGPAPDGVADDPEALEVLGELRELRSELHPSARDRVHLANLPTDDVEANARLVNALQRRADVVVQKSLAEGFGLTVTEAMWKARPIVAGGVGGIRDQIEDGVSGRLVDPRDLAAFASAVADLVADPALGAALGDAARRSVADRYLPTGYLGAYLELILELLGAGR
jgi:trehalose synthase